MEDVADAVRLAGEVERSMDEEAEVDYNRRERYG
jgi:hypothetical protein